MSKKGNDKRFIKGLFKDTAPLDQPEGSWRYARNMILNDTDGAVSNEGGTEMSGYIGNPDFNSNFSVVGDWNAKVVGKLQVDNDKVILFSLDITAFNRNTLHRCEIGIWIDGVYSTLFNPNLNLHSTHSLNFNTQSLIEGTFKIDSKGDLIIYWTDDFNSPRAFNVDRQQRWIDESSSSNFAAAFPGYIPEEWLYGINPNTSHLDHIDLLNLFPNSGPIPHIYLHDIFWVVDAFQKSVTTGGGLLTGVYHLGLAYVDDDQVSTNYVTISNPVSIVDEYDHTKPTTKKDGAKAGSQTSKAIKWRVENINTDYKYMRPVIIRKMGEAVEAFKLNRVEVSPDKNGNQEIVFSGLEGFTPSSVEDVIIDTISYETAKTVNQLDGVLYLGNLTGTNDLGYQKYANNIKLTSKTKIFPNFDTFYATIDNLQTGFGNSEVDVFNGETQTIDTSQSYRYAPNITNWKGYQRDEVYAFYIAFILKDGSMSYAYHIPGRAPLDTVSLEIDGDKSLSTYNGKDIYEHSALGDDGNGSVLNMVSGSSDLFLGTNTRIYEDLHKLSIPYSRNFHFFDFSRLSGSNSMNYWENATETYPNTDDYDIYDETGLIGSLREGTIDITTGNPYNTSSVNVRHHKFPSNENKDRTTVMEHLPGGSGRSGDNCEIEPTSTASLPISQIGGWDVTFYAFAKSKIGEKRTTFNNDEFINNEAACDDVAIDFSASNGVYSEEFGYPNNSGHPGTNDTIAHGDSLQIANDTTNDAVNGNIVDVMEGLHSILIGPNHHPAWNALSFTDKHPYGVALPNNTIYDPTKVAISNNQPLPIQVGGVTSYDKFNNTFVTHPNNTQLQAFNALWDGNKGVFTADQKMTVKIKPSVWFSAGTISGGSYNPLASDNLALVARKRDSAQSNASGFADGFRYGVLYWGQQGSWNQYRKIGNPDTGSALFPPDHTTGRKYCVCTSFEGASPFYNASEDMTQHWKHQEAVVPFEFELEEGDQVHLGFMVWADIASSIYMDLDNTFGDDKIAHLKYSSGCHDWDTEFSPQEVPIAGEITGWHKYNVSHSQIEFEVLSEAQPIDDFHFNDVKVEHQVQALGFTLDDIKIPKSIADKVQGFRIYHAKRGHADRSILGQAPSLPMRPAEVKVGMCSEAWALTNITNSAEIMASLSDKTVSVLRKDPWPTWDSFYPEYSTLYDGADAVNVYHGYKTFSFPDFHLLRTKNSISGATHVKPVYRVQNFIWNGPNLAQDKKMVTKIVYDTSYNPDLKRLEENWGWDTQHNCYAMNIRSALFIGAHYNIMQSTDTEGWYNSFRPFSIPRVLGQKAITYLKGDSVFKGEALGFGGTILNERGDSTIVYGLKDRHEVPAADQSLSSSCSDYSMYGGNPNNAARAFTLVGDPVTNMVGTSGSTPYTGSGTYCNRKSNTVINNLCSFKTDVYKSIDTQELVWTGFEVLGEDLNNFIFWDQKSLELLPGSPLTNPSEGDPLTFQYQADLGTGLGIQWQVAMADYSIYTLQVDIQRTYQGTAYKPEWGQWHIFGGDTFICRYGFGSGVTYLDSGTNSQPKRGIYYHIIESPDNINFRHAESTETSYFPGSSATDILSNIGKLDLNRFENLTYNDNYSAVNDIRPAFPLPLSKYDQDDFPTRTHRSVKTDTTSLIDNYRIFKANQFKDLPKNRGDLWKLSTFNNLLYFHMQESLYAAKGKQSMQMKDGSEAFVGSGDIFQQEPDEVIQTKSGYGGTQSQWAAITTRAGYFFVDANSRKIFLMKDKLGEISKIGMETWFRDNMSFELEKYGYTGCSIDNPLEGLGFHSVYDPIHKRIILTKREFIPTQLFIDNYLIEDGNTVTSCGDYRPLGYIRFNSSKCVYEYWDTKKTVYQDDVNCKWYSIPFSCNSELAKKYFTCSGWTISYYTDLGVWGSFHDYIPYIYFNTTKNFYSLTDQYFKLTYCTPNMITNAAALNIPFCLSFDSSDIDNYDGTTYGNSGIWKHNSFSNHGILYQENVLSEYSNLNWLESVDHYPFEFELIHNEVKSLDSLLASYSYTLETINQSGISVLEHGFTSYFVYNTFQISGEETIEYLINTRRVGNNWKVNKFRDMAAIVDQTGDTTTGLNLPNTSAYYTAAGNNIIGGTNTGTLTTSSINSMFNIAGMAESINANYIDLTKNWNQRRKFIDKWVGIRLIYDNITNNLLNLYSTNVVIRKLYR